MGFSFPNPFAPQGNSGGGTPFSGTNWSFNPSGGGPLGSILSNSWKNMLGNPGSQGASGASAPNNQAGLPSNAVSNPFNANGEPAPPGFVHVVNPENIASEKQFGTDTSFLRGYGNGTAASPWLGLQNQAIDRAAGQSRNQALNDASAAQQHALDSVAMNGGLGSGDAARMAGLGLQGQQQSLQGISAGANQAKATAAATDAQNRLSVAQNLPGMDLQNAGFLNSAYDFDQNAKNDQQNFVYGQKMQQYGANQVGNAIANSKKPGLLG